MYASDSLITGYLHDGGTLNLQRFELFMKELAKACTYHKIIVRSLLQYSYAYTSQQ